MSGFPGPEGYAEFAARERERDRETARQDVPPVERSAEFYDVTDLLNVRLEFLRHTKADRITDRELEKTVNALALALRHIKALQERIERLQRLMGGR